MLNKDYKVQGGAHGHGKCFVQYFFYVAQLVGVGGSLLITVTAVQPSVTTTTVCNVSQDPYFYVSVAALPGFS